MRHAPQFIRMRLGTWKWAQELASAKRKAWMLQKDALCQSHTFNIFASVGGKAFPGCLLGKQFENRSLNDLVTVEKYHLAPGPGLVMHSVDPLPFLWPLGGQKHAKWP